jgi:hypothetical protein
MLAGLKKTRMDAVQDALDKLRQLCLGLPQVTERLSHGEPTWFIQGKKSFVMFSTYHHGGPLGFWCAAPPGAQEALVASNPRRFFRPPYVGYRGWLGVSLEGDVDWDEVADIIEEAYQVIAPKSLLK